jgi:hypothetical protein
MLGFRYLKATPTTHVLHYHGGKLVHDGVGLSFWYFAPTDVIALVPISSRDVPFVFNEVTADFQDVTIQGDLTCRIRDVKKVAALLDHTADTHGLYRSEDPSKLNDRLIHAAQILTRAFTQKRPLKEVLVNSDALVSEVLEGLKSSDGVAMLGVEVLGLSIISIKAAPEMSKALQTDAREELLRRADEAIYARRNAAVELERTIKENELNTEVAVQTKQREIAETKLNGQIAIEERRRSLVSVESDNIKTTADAQAYAAEAQLKPLRTMDTKALQVLAAGSSDPRLMVAMAFQEIAANATKVGNLNISPELLDSLLRSTPQGRPNGR